MRKVAAMLILLFAGLSCLVFADNKPVSLTVGQTFSYGSADIKEYVFDYYPPAASNGMTGTREKLSELDWDMHDLHCVGGGIQFKSDLFAFGVRYQERLFNSPGFMQDSDWNSDDRHLTNYSRHDNKVTSHKDFSIDAGLSFVRNKKANAFLTFGLQYMFTDMDAVNGWATYENDGWVKSYFDGAVISYRQIMTLLWAGFSEDIHITPEIDWSLSFAFMPYIYAKCIDWHWQRDIIYIDLPESGSGVKMGTSLSIDFSDQRQLVVSGSVVSVSQVVGNDYDNENHGGHFVLESLTLGGTGYFGWDVSLSYRMRIF